MHAIPSLLDWLAAPPPPTPGRLALGSASLTWDTQRISLEGAQGDAPLVLTAAETSLQLSRWSAPEEVPASGFWAWLFGRTETVERHFLLVELRSARRRVRLRAAVEAPERLRGLARMDAVSEATVSLDALEGLLCAAVTLGMPLVRAELGGEGGSSWLEEPLSQSPLSKRERRRVDIPAREAQHQPTPSAPTSPSEPEPEPEQEAPLPAPVEAAPAERQAVVRVGFAPEADTRSLLEALTRVAPGGRIELGPGRFRAPQTLVLEESVELAGAGPLSTTLVGGRVPLLRFVPTDANQGELVLREIGLEPERRATGPAGAALVELGGQARLEGCSIDGKGGNADIGLRISAGAVSLTGCLLVAHGGDGLRVEGDARVRISGGSADRNGDAGVRVRGEAQASLERLTARDNRGTGIVVEASAQVTVRECTARANEAGITVVDQATAEITGCECLHNRATGISLHSAGEGVVRDNRCHRNPTDLVSAAPRFEVRDNRLG